MGKPLNSNEEIDLPVVRRYQKQDMHTKAPQKIPAKALLGKQTRTVLKRSGLVAVAIVVALGASRLRRPTVEVGGKEVPPPFESTDQPRLPGAPTPEIHDSTTPLTDYTTTVNATDERPSAPEPHPGATAEPSGESRQLVTGLTTLNFSNAPASDGFTARWKQDFQTLVQTGSAGIPAILEFLKLNRDFEFDTTVSQAIGFQTARQTMFEALLAIGGPEGTSATLATLQTTADPKEIALLAQNLDKLDPGQHRSEALAAARTGMALAAHGDLPGRDVAPLFEVFQRFGDASTAPELEQAASQWKYYATLALANLPEAAGIPSILKMADPSGSSQNRLVALEMVVQLSVDHPEVREFLVNQMLGKQIPVGYWAYLESPLSGNQYYPAAAAITQYPALQSMSDLKTTHIESGNQNLYTLPATRSMSSDGIAQFTALIDELTPRTTDPTALATLQKAREALEKRAARGAAQTPPP